jgi:hypothetical protein
VSWIFDNGKKRKIVEIIPSSRSSLLYYCPWSDMSTFVDKSNSTNFYSFAPIYKVEGHLDSKDNSLTRWQCKGDNNHYYVQGNIIADGFGNVYASKEGINSLKAFSTCMKEGYFNGIEHSDDCLMFGLDFYSSRFIQDSLKDENKVHLVTSNDVLDSFSDEGDLKELKKYLKIKK